MTVIAYDGKTLAADSRTTCGDVITNDNLNKIYKIDFEYLGDRLRYVALAGHISDYERFVAVLLPMLGSNEDVKHNVSGIIIGTNYVYELEPNQLFLMRFNKRHKLAIGSGEDYARSAMALGLNAVEAIKHAIKHVCSCGGKINKVIVYDR